MNRRLFVPAFALLAAVLPAHAQDKQVNVICSAAGDWCSLVQATFAKSSGIKVNMLQKSSGEALAQILAERDNPKTDLWFGGTGDPHMMAAEQGLTLEYKSPVLSELHPWAVQEARLSGYRTTALYVGALGFAYNTELLAKKKLPVPHTWADLLRPEYRGEVQMANPTSAGTAYTTIATVVQLMGPDKSWDYLRKLHKNIAVYQRSGMGPLKAVSRGEATISISFIGDVANEQAQGFPVQFVTPSDGTGAELASISIVKGARNLENARKLYDWALTPAAQQLGPLARVFTLPSNMKTPLDPRVPDYGKIKLIDYDYGKYGSAAERRRLIDAWERRVYSQAQ